MSAKKHGKLHILITAGLSFLALAVTSISTAAWFAVTTSGAQPTHNVTSGSSDITIGSVSSYKFHAADLDASTKSTTEGVISRYAENASEKTYNPHQDEHHEITFDTPSEGVGYYLIGNTAFSKSGKDAYTYDAGYKMSSASAGNATIYNVYLESGMRFNIKRHYYDTLDNEVVAKNVIVQCSLSSTGDATKTGNSTDDVIYTGDSATYTVTLANGTITLSGKVANRKYLKETENRGSSKARSSTDDAKRSRSAFSALSPKKKLSSSDNVYFCGQLNGWTLSDADYKFDSAAEPFLFKLLIDFNDGNKREFKLNNGSWSAEYTNITLNVSSGSFTKLGSGNLRCDDLGQYYFLVDDDGNITIRDPLYIRGPAINDSDWNVCSSSNRLNSYNNNYAEGSGITLSTGQFKVADKNWATVNIGSVTGQYMPDKKTTLSSSDGLGGNVFGTADGNITCGHAGKFDFYVYYDSGYKLNIIARATKVTFDKQSGSGGDSSVGAWEDQAMPTISVPSRTGYSFGGYYSGQNGQGTKYYKSDGTSNAYWDITDSTKTLYAFWTLNSITITLDDGSGSGGSGTTTASYGSSIANVAVPTYSGRSFLGYYTGADGTGEKYFNADGSCALSQERINAIANAGSAVTVHAWWATQTTITFNAQSGSSISGVTAIYGSDMPTLSNPPSTRTGYTLLGIFDSSSGGTKYYNADGTSAKKWDKTDSTKTLYAQWSANQYTVALDRTHTTASSGSTSVTATFGSSMPSATMPTWSGYAFNGYFDNSTGGTKYYNANGSSAKNWDKASDTTLYAQWTIDMTGKTTYYVLDDGALGDGTLYLYCKGPDNGSGSDFYYHVAVTTLYSSSNYSNLYTVDIPKYSTGGFCFYKGTLGTVNPSNKTDMISIDGADSFSTARGSKTMLLLEKDNTDGVHKVKWGTLPASKPASDGYYRALDFSSSAVAMNNSYLATNDKAVDMKISIAANTEFQIWLLNSKKLSHFDTVASGENQQATRTSAGNVKITNAGTYNLYLNSSGDIYVGATQMYELVIIDGTTGNSTTYAMSPGDTTTYNKWVYEKAITVKQGDKFYIHGKAGGNADEYKGIGQLPLNEKDDQNHDLPSYKNAATFLKDSGTTYHGVTAYEFKDGGDYTFYWTRGDKFTVASVPTLGYGYYILTDPAKAYAGNVVKMKTITDRTDSQNKAFYYSFYATENQKLAFRSYLDGIDKYFTHDQIDNSSYHTEVSLGADTNHVINITTAGYYNIFVTGSGHVSIAQTADESDSAYMLSRLVPGGAANNGNTFLILEVGFTTSNIDRSEVLLEVNNSISGVGYSFMLSKGKMDDPYNEMKDITLSTTSEVTAYNSDFKTVANNSSIVYYAYIFIDYTTAGKSNTHSGSLSFSLKSKQYVEVQSSNEVLH